MDVAVLKQLLNEGRVCQMKETDDKKIVVKRPYTAPKLVEYGSVSKLTEAKSAGMTDAVVGIHHNA